MNNVKNIEERIKAQFDIITSISATESGCTRFSYSKEDILVKEHLIKECLDIGMTVNMDKIGNLRFKYNPNNLNSKSILVGSHIDTVKNGGKYDGLTGVICALESIKSIDIEKLELKHPIELVIFAEEEGSNFGVTMLGSKYISKRINDNYFEKIFNEENVTAKEVIENFNIEGITKRDSFITGDNELSFIELHVEQGGVLEHKGITIGIVDVIAGMKSLKVKINGQSNHAGTTPMVLRKDPLVIAAELIIEISKLPKKLSLDTAVSTVGKIEAKPNVSNVINEEIKFSIDIRDGNKNSIEVMKSEILRLVHDISDRKVVSIEIEELGGSDPVLMSDNIKNIIEESVLKSKISYMHLNSGAVHDNAMLDGIIDIGMIFLPSKDGISHSPYEHTDLHDIVYGYQVLYESLLKLDRFYD